MGSLSLFFRTGDEVDAANSQQLEKLAQKAQATWPIYSSGIASDQDLPTTSQIGGFCRRKQRVENNVVQPENNRRQSGSFFCTPMTIQEFPK